ncbi:MAG: class I SAM-dependent methyltransferase [Acidobacteriota bacterium]
MTQPTTDWNSYYRKNPGFSRFTRPVIERELITTLRQFCAPKPVVMELGGAGSCVFDSIAKNFQPAEYHIVDTNQYGLDLMRNRAATKVSLHCEDVRELTLPVRADAVFSLGLIEHFDESGTEQAILAHLRHLKPGGVAIISFPTPTLLYRGTRALAELSGRWIFHDERPLRMAEVADVMRREAQIVHSRLLWPIFLTQWLIAARKPALETP